MTNKFRYYIFVHNAQAPGRLSIYGTNDFHVAKDEADAGLSVLDTKLNKQINVGDIDDYDCYFS
jgi:hypothetical protein